MKQKTLILFLFTAVTYIAQSQENRFSATLDKYCKEVIREFRTTVPLLSRCFVKGSAQKHINPEIDLAKMYFKL